MCLIDVDSRMYYRPGSGFPWGFPSPFCNCETKVGMSMSTNMEKKKMTKTTAELPMPVADGRLSASVNVGGSM